MIYDEYFIIKSKEMNIIILCDQTDCMYNAKGSTFQHCTFNHPVFFRVGDKRQCVSRRIKHIVHVVNQCAICLTPGTDYCMNICPVTKGEGFEPIKKPNDD